MTDDDTPESRIRRGDDRSDTYEDKPHVRLDKSGNWLGGDEAGEEDEERALPPLEEMTEDEIREEFDNADEIIRELRESDQDTVV